MTIHRICVAGGPGSGKTSVMPFLQKALEGRGYEVRVVPETAVEVFALHEDARSISAYELQERILRRTLHKEAAVYNDVHMQRSRNPGTGRPTIIFYNRGSMDSAAYVSAAAFDRLCVHEGRSVMDLRDRDYDGVVFMRSTAVDAPHLYTRANNRERTETPEEAAALDIRTLWAWVAHPHLWIVDNSTGWEEKQQRVLDAVLHLVGDPEPLEIERKYLVNQCDMSALPLPAQAVHIEQYYLTSDGAEGVARIRARSQGGSTLYYRTRKCMVREGVVRETEHLVTRQEYGWLLNDVDPACGKIEKIRYCFVYKGRRLELDVFTRPHGLVMLECEMLRPDETPELPLRLVRGYREVTNDPEWSNAAIARRIAEGLWVHDYVGGD